MKIVHPAAKRDQLESWSLPRAPRRRYGGTRVATWPSTGGRRGSHRCNGRRPARTPCASSRGSGDGRTASQHVLQHATACRSRARRGPGHPAPAPGAEPWARSLLAWSRARWSWAGPLARSSRKGARARWPWAGSASSAARGRQSLTRSSAGRAAESPSQWSRPMERRDETIASSWREKRGRACGAGASRTSAPRAAVRTR